jgi:hypothetical protein
MRGNSRTSSHSNLKDAALKRAESGSSTYVNTDLGTSVSLLGQQTDSSNMSIVVKEFSRRSSARTGSSERVESPMSKRVSIQRDSIVSRPRSMSTTTASDYRFKLENSLQKTEEKPPSRRPSIITRPRSASVQVKKRVTIDASTEGAEIPLHAMRPPIDSSTEGPERAEIPQHVMRQPSIESPERIKPVSSRQESKDGRSSAEFLFEIPPAICNLGGNDEINGNQTEQTRIETIKQEITQATTKTSNQSMQTMKLMLQNTRNEFDSIEQTKSEYFDVEEGIDRTLSTLQDIRNSLRTSRAIALASSDTDILQVLNRLHSCELKMGLLDNMNFHFRNSLETFEDALELFSIELLATNNRFLRSIDGK